MEEGIGAPKEVPKVECERKWFSLVPWNITLQSNQDHTAICFRCIEKPHLEHTLSYLQEQSGGIMRVEELEKYGARLEMPKEAVKEQDKIILRALRKRFGLWGTIAIFKDTFKNQIRLKRQYPETRRKAAAISEVIEKELFLFSGIFLSLAKRLGREGAYEFFKTKVMNEIAKTSMSSLYQLNDLKKCEGDIFENFKKFNIAMFERTTRDGTWLMESYEDETDKLTIKITTCANVELFSELGVPELGKFGCDHDLAGYPVIEDDVDCEFRRMCTIAKGDDCCIFEFYRKGTAPDNAHLNK